MQIDDMITKFVKAKKVKNQSQFWKRPKQANLEPLVFSLVTEEK